MFRKVEYGSNRYYTSLENDDFEGGNPNKVKLAINENYKYIQRNIFFRFFSFIIYYFIAIPILFIYSYFFEGVRVKGRGKLKKIKGGYVIYANHTHTHDAYLGHVFIARPKRTYIIASKIALGIPVIRSLVKMLGFYPIPEGFKAYKNFNNAIKETLQKGNCIIVYPEAHIWNFYTHLRPFPSASFHYAADNNVACVGAAITYRKPKGLFKKYLKPRATINILDPLYPDPLLSLKENINMLHDKIWDEMNNVIEDKNNYPLYEYMKKPE